jgi:hypothetical protein
MPSVSYVKAFLHRAEDLEDWIGCWVKDGRPQLEVDVTREFAASGRAILTRSRRRTRDMDLVLVDCDRMDLDWLEAAAGETLLIRVPRRYYGYGTFAVLAPTELPGMGATVDIPLAIMFVSDPTTGS